MNEGKEVKDKYFYLKKLRHYVLRVSSLIR
jgi:hypothetical protein